MSPRTTLPSSLPSWLPYVAAFCLASASPHAAAPQTLHFQGRVSVDGIPFSGTGHFRFALVDAADAVRWTSAPDTSPADGQPDTATNLPVTKGLYAVELGAGLEPLPPDLFSTHADLRLRVWFDDGVHAVQLLSPDQPLAAVPYARHSASADQAQSAVSAQSAQSAQSAVTVTGPVSAAQVSGMLALGQLPATVARLDSTPTFTGTVRAPAFQGAGSIPWVVTTDTERIATPNTGYLSDLEPGNGILVTLPAQAQPGDVVRVAAGGAGFWMAQGVPGDSVLGANPGKYWNATGPTLTWRSIAMSADGRRLIAAADGAPLHVSSDTGQTWITRQSARAWTSVTSSADGSVLAATEFNGPIWMSSDRGTNWTSRATPATWSSVAVSANGRNLVAAAGKPSVWVSLDSGVHWTETPLSRQLDAVDISADGNILMAAGEFTIAVSIDSGTTWRELYFDEVNSFSSIALSADGTRAVAGDFEGSLWFTEDTGMNWRAEGNRLPCSSVALSADGTRVIASLYGEAILYSRDFGFTWDDWPAPGLWRGVACSAEGLFFAAVGEDTEILTSAGIMAGEPGSMAEFVHLGGGRWRGFPFAMTPPASGRFVMDPPEFFLRRPASSANRNSHPLRAPAASR
jgi:hypothetical protein